MASIYTKTQLKLVVATWHFIKRCFLHHVTESDVRFKQIWLLCVYSLNLNSIWLYGKVYTTWHLFILCWFKWPLNLKLAEANMCFFYIMSWPRFICKQIWLLCVFNFNVNSLWSYSIVYITSRMFIIRGT